MSTKMSLKRRIGSMVIMLSMMALGLLFSTAVFASATYYVAKTGCSDTNAGTSSSAPWCTLGHASTLTYTAGDQLLLKGGDTWNEQLTLNSDGSGTSINPVIVSTYGTGYAKIDRGNSTVASD